MPGMMTRGVLAKAERSTVSGGYSEVPTPSEGGSSCSLERGGGGGGGGGMRGGEQRR